MQTRDDRGALHLVGILLVLLCVGGLFLVSSWSHEVAVLRDHVEQMQQKVEMLDLRVKNLEGRVVP
ncbi:MAG: hypothetical protein EBZ48_07215 [Proteobacteria bacterium]|nr:hypothetical protein [Pseudomonadota bacterium]